MTISDALLLIYLLKSNPDISITLELKACHVH